jgi:integrase/recombinase XerD
MHPDIQHFLERLDREAVYSQNTRRAYAYDLKRLDAYLGARGDGAAPAIQLEHLRSFLAAEAGAGFSRRTMERRKVVVRRLALGLAAQGRITEDPGLALDGHEFPEDGKEPVREAAPLTESEAAGILHALSSASTARGLRDRAIFTLLLETGMQISQLVGLELGAAVPDGVARANLEEYLKNGRPELAHGSNESALFISQMGSRMTRQTIWTMLRALGRSAGLVGPLTPRRLRHTAAARMSRAGLALADVQRKLGHQSPASTAALLARLPTEGSE